MGHLGRDVARSGHRVEMKATPGPVCSFNELLVLLLIFQSPFLGQISVL